MTLLSRSAGRTLRFCLAVLPLAACVVGPNYKGPPDVAAQSVAAKAFQRAGDATSETPGPRWWTALGDAELDRLIETALAASPDIEAATARLRQSRALLHQDRANGLPTSSASALALRAHGLTGVLAGGAAGSRGQTGAGSSDLEIYSTGFDATWELDLFGGNRRAVESAKADAQAYQADLEGVRVSLAADVAQAYVTLRDYQARLALSHRDVEVEERMLKLTQARRVGGTASDLDVERLNNQLQSTRADAEPLEARITDQLDRLAVLTGREPGTLDAELAPGAAMPTPPATVAVGDPAALLRRRPDVRAAERRLAGRNAVIGQRAADLFPKVTLLGDVGFTSADLSRLLTSGSFTSVAAPILQWSPLDFGRTQARIGQARAGRDEALANYRKTVLGALEDAESALSRYGRQREAVVSLARVKASADRAASLTDLKVQGGTATSLDQLDAEHRRIQAEAGLEQATAQVTQDYVALQKSLGLGWTAPGAG
jgi:NodT family efflux transporter outer membrane factor (OMF) lipoprotein